MAKLITAKDVLNCHQAGKTTCYLEPGTIVTPAARDEAKKHGICFEEGKKVRCQSQVSTEKGLDGITSDELLTLLKNMLLTGDSEPNKETPPYRCVSHTNGLKVVKGGTVRMDDFDTGTPDAKVGFQELVSQHESKMSAGFLTIDHSNFAWKLPYEEIDYVISGTVSIEIDGQTYVGRAGDVLFVPSGSDVIWGSPDNAKIFYTTYPSNWADLM
ncbi:cupin domain-containing protein [Streptococcus castoreus]|uniref:cupin domain-containing protein n=1 Tax=Streptococcus castoreus TaxID=254786 RepID=UPI00041B6D18|nr:cupin domain-containing protein [Streptococcus castoreus]